MEVLPVCRLPDVSVAERKTAQRKESAAFLQGLGGGSGGERFHGDRREWRCCSSARETCDLAHVT